MSRYCPNCGTEVDETAAFCPTCGQPIDQATEMEIPPAPAWPDHVRPAAASGAREAEPQQTAAPAETGDAADAWVEEPTRVEEPPPPPPPAQPAAAPAGRPPRGEVDLPVTMPVMLSAWLIGVGAIVAALGVVIDMFSDMNVIDLLLLLLLIGIAVTVFFSASVPAIPHLRLVTLVVVLIGFGIAIDRIGFDRAGVGQLLLFLGAAAAAIGSILLEMGRDQPLGGPNT
jgi:hypothetical protein